MFIRASDREYVPTILADYVERYHRPYHSICDEKLTEDDAVAMVIFYFRVVMPFVRKYLNFAIESDNAPNHQDYPIVPLRKAEKTRIFRAFYRFQICCNLFGVGGREGRKAPQSHYDNKYIPQHFFCIFPLWESEEIACIYYFSIELFDGVWASILWNPRVCERLADKTCG